MMSWPVMLCTHLHLPPPTSRCTKTGFLRFFATFAIPRWTPAAITPRFASLVLVSFTATVPLAISSADMSSRLSLSPWSRVGFLPAPSYCQSPRYPRSTPAPPPVVFTPKSPLHAILRCSPNGHRSMRYATRRFAGFAELAHDAILRIFRQMARHTLLLTYDADPPFHVTWHFIPLALHTARSPYPWYPLRPLIACH